ncbi:Lipocalin-like domain-containing protein [Frankia sp. EI5c]|uniref:lipocalin-like domain-containing protein n=1 Tax=Frankia sp. EI5c TaxID=683316 RepID=UPI0007C3F454|nr:lipocalin-like domain-containing protein [Frankia sp. EI5c]OAA28780.1 Lipocalin-like domain-containing protein [Frankia sp. EI5c]
MLAEKDLVGSWRLIAHFYLDDDGSTSEGPLGDGADGILIYGPDGFMAASMMRTGPAAGPARSGSPPASYLGSTDDYLGYSGQWLVRGREVVHQVLIGSHPRVVNTRQVREASLSDGLLTLRRHLDGTTRHVVMTWRRV